MLEADFLPYLAVMSVVTYLIRMLPMVLIRKKITNRFIRSFLHYMPYAVLSVMTVPACFYATGNIYSAAVGIFVALLLAYKGKSLITVAAGASSGVFITEMIMLLFK